MDGLCHTRCVVGKWRNGRTQSDVLACELTDNKRPHCGPHDLAMGMSYHPEMAWSAPPASEVAADWIASRKDGADKDSTGAIAQFLLEPFPRDEPDLTREVILLVMRSYSESDYFAAGKTEAQAVCGALAAGPVEDLLCFHGHRFIAEFEEITLHDRRMAWLLGGVWQSFMDEDIWRRVQRVAERSYWQRRSQL